MGRAWFGVRLRRGPAASVRWLVLLACLPCVLLGACSSHSPRLRPSVTVVTSPLREHPGTGSSGVPDDSPSRTVTPARPVHIKSLLAGGGETYGVGMPIIAFFSKKITNATALKDATKVTANGKPVNGGWYFERSNYHKGYPIEGHWRPGPTTFWPAHSSVHVNIAAKGVSAGKGLAYDDSLTLDFLIGAGNVSVVNDISHTITVVSDGHTQYTFPVSLGASNTPTRHGYKVIMEKLPTVCMHDTAGSYYECGIKFDQRLTYDGEYLHAAPWNCLGVPGCIGPANNIGSGDSSNGCTNLRPYDAAKLYHFLQVGDVVYYPNANGKQMGLGDGYGDWNVPWRVWQTGGIVPTH
jgi:lipoprotein-anchoring transpeptidase ErfK/SrfK